MKKVMARATAQRIQELLHAGLSQSDIARRYGVTRQHIHNVLKRSGYVPESTGQTKLIRDNFPWEIEDTEVYGNTVYIQLWLAARFNDDPDSISKTSIERVRSLVRKLVRFNQVVDYDPDYPWVKGLLNTKGIAFLPRTVGDEDYMIKIRPGVRITPVGETLWRMPDLKKLRL